MWYVTFLLIPLLALFLGFVAGSYCHTHPGSAGRQWCSYPGSVTHKLLSLTETERKGIIVILNNDATVSSANLVFPGNRVPNPYQPFVTFLVGVGVTDAGVYREDSSSQETLYVVPKRSLTDEEKVLLQQEVTTYITTNGIEEITAVTVVDSLDEFSSYPIEGLLH